ncbi:MAG TPA: hypothetical protein VHL11_15515 [Phototrophicaceae bacterium]|nr:hypothetical protein [Phototrophicaceae bacterium]
MLAVCDAVIVHGKLDGGTAKENDLVDGLSLRCMADDPNDTNGDGIRNLSNIVVVYNHLVLLDSVDPLHVDKDSNQLVRVGDPVARTSSYYTSTGKCAEAHLHMETFIAQDWKSDISSDIVQVNPLFMFDDTMVQKHNTSALGYETENMDYASDYTEWSLEGDTDGQNLNFWTHPENAAFSYELVNHLNPIYTQPVYIGPDCIGLPADISHDNFGPGTQFTSCISISNNDDR